MNVRRWFPHATEEQITRILWNCTPYPAGDAQLLDDRLKHLACKLMPELPGFEDRLVTEEISVVQEIDAILDDLLETQQEEP